MDLDRRRVMDDYTMALNAVMFAKNREGQYLFVNEEFCRAARMKEEDIIGKDDQSLWPGRAADYVRNDEIIWRTEKAFTYQETAALDARIFLVMKFPICKENKMYALGVLSVDITDSVEELKDSLGSIGRLQVALEQSQNMLRALQLILPQ